MLNRYSFTVLLLSLSTCVFAQKSARLETSEISAAFNYYGTLFSSDVEDAKFNPIYDTALSSIYTGALWLSALDPSGSIFTAAQTYSIQPSGAPQSDYSAGPIATSYIKSSYQSKYQRLWKVSSAEIDMHRSNFNSAGYAAPQAIMDWPAHGDTTNGESWRLAPFADLNGNDIYEPMQGDYPIIRGDDAIYMIFNDDNRPNALTTSPLGLEIHLMAYVFNDTARAIQNTVFLAYRIINHSPQGYMGLKASLFLDYDLGNSVDDLTGTDSINNIAYVYNSLNNDMGANGFGKNPPAAGVSSLNERAEGAIFYENNPTPTGNPLNELGFYNVMRLNWKNGAPLVVENPAGLGSFQNGDGYQPGGSPITTWHYNEARNWYENPSNFSDKRGLLSMPDKTLNSDEELCYDFAVSFSHDTSASSSFLPYRSVIGLKNNFAQVQQFYNSQNFACLDETVSLSKIEHMAIEIYPNPVRDKLVIKTTKPLQQIKLYDLTGNAVGQYAGEGKLETHLKFSGKLRSGIYIIKLIDQKGLVLSRRIVIQ